MNQYRLASTAVDAAYLTMALSPNGLPQASGAAAPKRPAPFVRLLTLIRGQRSLAEPVQRGQSPRVDVFSESSSASSALSVSHLRRLCCRDIESDEYSRRP
jgi:hypothetical protein